MEWFLFFVVLNLGHKYAYGEEITMFVNVNDTVDLKVEKEAKQGILYSCKAQLYSDTGVFIKDYTLMEIKIWELNKNDQSVMKYFEFLDYKGSCSFTISPFPSEFYGHWIINTTTDIGEDEEVMYNYKYQEFYLTTPPKENTSVMLQKNMSSPKDDHLEPTSDKGTFFLSISNQKDYQSEDTNDTENHIYSTHNIECRNTNPISLRPKKVLGQIKKCIAFHHHDIVKTENATETDSHYRDKTVYEIYPDTSHEFVFTGNNNSCQFKIIEMRYRYFKTRNYRLQHPLYERWEIRTYYEDQLTNQISQRRDTFKIHLISKNFPRPQEKKKRVQPMIRGSTYIKLERSDTTTNSTVLKFKYQPDGQTEKIRSERNNSILPEDSFYHRIDTQNYGYSYAAKDCGNYDFVFERTNKTYQIYEHMYIYATNKVIQHPKKSFDSPLREAWRRGCNNILAIEGSMFPFWLTDNIPENTYDKELQVVVQMPNGTLIKTHYIQNSSLSTELGTNSLSHSAMLERKNLYKNLSIIDNGFWKINYQNKFSKDPLYSRFTAFYSVSTWDSTHVKVVVDMTTENSSISIYNIQKNPKRCLLLSTDGTVVQETEPTVHNVSRNTICLRQIKEIDNLNECEFKINQLSDSDYDMKTFSIDYGNFTINRTIILQNNFGGMKKYNEISDMQKKNSHFVLRDDEFLVNCSQNRPLLFCRIQTPTEEVTHITDENALEAGNCWLLVENASIFYHNGTWKCQLAFNESNIGSTIIEYFFSVQVRSKRS